MSNNKQKKIGPFDGYRSNAFFGFNIPKIPKITHFHLPIAQTKYVPIRRSKSIEDLFGSFCKMDVSTAISGNNVDSKIKQIQLKLFPKSYAFCTKSDGNAGAANLETTSSAYFSSTPTSAVQMASASAVSEGVCKDSMSKSLTVEEATKRAIFWSMSSTETVNSCSRLSGGDELGYFDPNADNEETILYEDVSPTTKLLATTPVHGEHASKQSAESHLKFETLVDTVTQLLSSLESISQSPSSVIENKGRDTEDGILVCKQISATESTNQHLSKFTESEADQRTETDLLDYVIEDKDSLEKSLSFKCDFSNDLTHETAAETSSISLIDRTYGEYEYLSCSAEDSKHEATALPRQTEDNPIESTCVDESTSQEPIEYDSSSDSAEETRPKRLTDEDYEHLSGSAEDSKEEASNETTTPHQAENEISLAFDSFATTSISLIDRTYEEYEYLSCSAEDSKHETTDSPHQTEDKPIESTCVEESTYQEPIEYESSSDSADETRPKRLTDEDYEHLSGSAEDSKEEASNETTTPHQAENEISLAFDSFATTAMNFTGFDKTTKTSELSSLANETTTQVSPFDISNAGYDDVENLEDSQSSDSAETEIQVTVTSTPLPQPKSSEQDEIAKPSKIEKSPEVSYDNESSAMAIEPDETVGPEQLSSNKHNETIISDELMEVIDLGNTTPIESALLKSSVSAPEIQTSENSDASYEAKMAEDVFFWYRRKSQRLRSMSDADKYFQEIEKHLSVHCENQNEMNIRMEGNLQRMNASIKFFDELQEEISEQQKLFNTILEETSGLIGTPSNLNESDD